MFELIKRRLLAWKIYRFSLSSVLNLEKDAIELRKVNFGLLKQQAETIFIAELSIS